MFEITTAETTSNDVGPLDLDVAHTKMFVGIFPNALSKVMVTSISEFALQSNAGVKTDPVCIFTRPVKLLYAVKIATNAVFDMIKW